MDKAKEILQESGLNIQIDNDFSQAAKTGRRER